jgi:CubicO group peptidase (beta-lactamase class C family)
MQRELFAPLGMRNVTFELDATATPVGSKGMFASARDWARFGLLYLNDGVVGGRRILPPGWVAYSSSPTLDTDYGAGFWTNAATNNAATRRIRGGMPPDAFYASGNLGQRVVIVPSMRLVVVRLGVSQDWPDFDMKGFVRLISDTIAALKRSP